MSKSSIALIALHTIAFGTPDKPATAAPGDRFEVDAADGERLVKIGFAKPAGKEVAAKPEPADVPIPEGWQNMSAAELVTLAGELGADKSVNTRAEATAFIGKVADERKKAS